MTMEGCKMKLEIEMSLAAFDGEERSRDTRVCVEVENAVRRALAALARESDGFTAPGVVSVRDVNGNPVGSVRTILTK